MMNKKKWVILISAVLAVVLAIVLLIVFLGGSDTPKEQPGENNATPDTSEVADANNNGVEVGIDLDDEEIDDSMVIDFDDLLEAAGK